MTNNINDSLNELNTIGAVAAYIKRHETMLGFRPSAVGLSRGERLAVLKDLGVSDLEARFMTGKTEVLGIPLVEVA